MGSAVYFSKEFSEDAIRTCFERAFADTGGAIGAKSRVAVKVHFGEEGNTHFVSPRNLKPILTSLKGRNGDHFLTDGNALYRGMRHNTSDHLEIARRHGFTTLGVPVVIADAEGEKEVEIPGRIFKKVRISRQIAESDALVVVSHFKGHMLFGFGGVIKNLGMGSGSRAGKLEMHAVSKPFVGEGCTVCGKCAEVCPADAILVDADTAKIDPDACEGCATCISVCDANAVEIPWMELAVNSVMERTAEYALGARSGKPCVCITFMNHLAKDCDCMADTEIIGRDVGIVASADPVACEQAAFDLVREAHGGADIFRKAIRIDGTHILGYAEAIGLGARAYRLVAV